MGTQEGRHAFWGAVVKKARGQCCPRDARNCKVTAVRVGRAGAPGRSPVAVGPTEF